MELGPREGEGKRERERERERERGPSIALDHSLGFKLSCHNYLKPIKFIYVPKQVH